MSMEVEPRSCWFCRRPVLVGERANRALHGAIAVHTDCLRDEATDERIRPARSGAAGDCRGGPVTLTR
jgi:hypothetical protein